MFNFSKSKSDLLKVCAIFFVVTAHYYRYVNNSSCFSFFYHFGFYGAALFAFLSGWGVYYSYEKKGFYEFWMVKKLVNIYIPFLLIQILANMFIYHSKFNFSEIIGVFFVKNDGVMWYIPYIMIFYSIFYIIFKLRVSENEKIAIFTSVVIFQILVGILLDIPSNWYTSSGALASGVISSRFLKKYVSLKKIFFIFGVFLIVSVLELYVKQVLFISNLLTTISGSFFCIIIYALVSGNEIIESTSIVKVFVSSFAKISFWVYMIHNKVFYYFTDNGSYLLVPLIILSFFISYVFKYVYEFLKTKLSLCNLTIYSKKHKK